MASLEEEANDDDITKPDNANATTAMGDKDATTGEKGMDEGRGVGREYGKEEREF
ncbi:hypothetical protein PI125_g19416 [Phytophthora idaei]|nr:hypothetical protein PI125_g19416 [Phytophthora idaei]KAG3132083.1 hypothetical protein PI126_g19786 [Phytophthora idaei]